MRRFLTTTAILLPLGAGMALAQDQQAPEAGTAPDAGMTAPEAGTTEPGAAEAPGAEAPETDENAQLESEMAESDQIVREQAENELRVEWINGSSVMSPEGETLGSINELILDGETGEMKAAILSVGGFLGIGAKQIAVPWGELQIDYDANEVTLPLTREQAEAAPEYSFREQEQPPAPAPAGGTGGMGTGTGTGGMGTGTGGMGTGTGAGN